MENAKKQPYFLGTFNRNLDEKNRLAIPARLRSQLERAQQEDEVVYLFCNPVEKRIKIYTYDAWMENGMPKLDEISDIYERHRREDLLYKLLEEQVLDSQGRITIKESFRKAVGIEKEAEIIGTGKSITIKKPEEDDDILDIRKEDESFIVGLSF